MHRYVPIFITPCLFITTKDLTRFEQGEGLRNPHPRAGIDDPETLRGKEWFKVHML
jgi:hypothetical protein